jgi:hypothetical protein
MGGAGSRPHGSITAPLDLIGVDQLTDQLDIGAAEERHRTSRVSCTPCYVLPVCCLRQPCPTCARRNQMTTNTTPAVDAMTAGRSSRVHPTPPARPGRGRQRHQRPRGTQRHRHRSPRRSRPHVPLPPPRPARTHPRRRNPATGQTRNRILGHSRVATSRPACRPATLHPHGCTHPTTRDPPVRTAQ